MSKFVYKAWIPTVTGRLSFDLIGQTSHPTHAESANISDRECRNIFVFQDRERVTRDAVLALPFRHFFNSEGVKWFVMLAKGTSENQRPIEFIEGKVFFIEDISKQVSNPLYCTDKSSKLNINFHAKEYDSLKNIFRSYQALLNGWVTNREIRSCQLSLGELYDDVLNDLTRKLQGLCLWETDFRLDRTGELKLELDSNKRGACIIPLAEPFNENIISLASQSFYFLKDVSHTHQHHHETTDTLLDVYREGDEEKEIWKYFTLRALYRTTLQLKRNKDVCDYARARGVLAYARAFIQTFGQDCEDKRLDLDPQWKYNYSRLVDAIKADNLIDSINAGSFLAGYRAKRLKDTHWRVIGFFLAVFSFLVALIGSLRLTPKFTAPFEPDELLIHVGKFLLSNPLSFLLIVGVLLYIYLIVFVFDIGRNGFVQRIYKLLSFMRKYVLASIFLGVSVAALAAIVLLQYFNFITLP
ncbi:MAG: hypothetical protein GVY13_14160 [Alphaproteobacteria bacterium]|nr:hypothetical protein [Alphaproteobacteria bacterium]